MGQKPGLLKSSISPPRAPSPRDGHTQLAAWQPSMATQENLPAAPQAEDPREATAAECQAAPLGGQRHGQGRQEGTPGAHTSPYAKT